ncbi:MAG: hypothetical protein LBO66_06225 [Deltaproteobacteria bacterium]|nr:hypothetical protein [Deltaproteobacteria bacterium]
MLEFISLPQTWKTYLDQIIQLIFTLEDISSWLPSDRLTLENIIHLRKDNIEGVTYKDKFDNNKPKGWQLSPEYEAIIRSKLDDAALKIQLFDPQYKPPAVEPKKVEACFVVTATMGNGNHPTVLMMRDFRDECLEKRKVGVALIRIYYKFGPILASVIKRHWIFRKLSFFFIVAPAARVARRILKRN